LISVFTLATQLAAISLRRWYSVIEVHSGAIS